MLQPLMTERTTEPHMTTDHKTGKLENQEVGISKTHNQIQIKTGSKLTVICILKI